MNRITIHISGYFYSFIKRQKAPGSYSKWTAMFPNFLKQEKSLLCLFWNIVLFETFEACKFILIKNKNNKKDVTSWRGDITYMYISCYKRCILNFIFLVIQRNLIKFWIRNKILIGWILMYQSSMYVWLYNTVPRRCTVHCVTLLLDQPLYMYMYYSTGWRRCFKV